MTGRYVFKISIFIVVLSGIVLFLSKTDLFSKSFQNEHDSHRIIGQVMRGDIVQSVTISGTIRPKRSVSIEAPYKGYIKKIYVKNGEKVDQRDPIVSITESISAKSGESFPIRAPFSGKIVTLNGFSGMKVSEGNSQNPIAVIEDQTAFYVWAKIPELNVNKVKIGQKAIIRFPAIANKTYDGKISYIALSSKNSKEWNKSKVLFEARIKVLNPDNQIKSGMSALSDIIAVQLKDILTLRHEFIERDEGKFFVTTIDNERKEIKVGIQNEVATQILSGVEENVEILQVDFLSLAKKRQNR